MLYSTELQPHSKTLLISVPPSPLSRDAIPPARANPTPALEFQIATLYRPLVTTRGDSPASTRPRIGVLWRGDPTQPVPSGDATRLRDIFRSLSEHGAEAVPLVFADEAADRALRELLACDGVLVWVDPIVDGVNRSVLDATLRAAAARGVYISANPDIILVLGAKDVLYTTRAMSWGTDVRLYTDAGDLAARLPQALDAGPRVLKQHRGNGGSGVWRVEWMPARPGTVYLLHGLRGSAVETMSFDELLRRLGPYFAGGACMVDQAFQQRLGDGMIRCYLAQDRVAGFGHQLVTALLGANEPGLETPAPPPRLYYGPGEPGFQRVKQRMESEWLPELLRTLDLTPGQLPAVWDVDLLYGPRTTSGNDSFVLCEINISSVFPLPDEAIDPLVEVAIKQSLAAKLRRGS